jgi:hypothetical protein
MAINFPNSPAINNTVIVGTDTWFWNGVAWEVKPVALESTASILSGNAATATKLLATKNINNVAFDGTANITLSTLVNGTNVLTLGSDGVLTTPDNNLSINSSATPGTSYGIIGKNNLTVALYSQGTGGVLIGNIVNNVDTTWDFGVDGVLDAPGNITTTTGTVAARAVTTTNDVTVGGNANISTVPTLPTHATNKKYVDGRAIAIAIALS